MFPGWETNQRSERDMVVVGAPMLNEFARRHADAQPRLNAWIAEAQGASWTTPNDVKARYPSASILAENRVVFNIGGNAYRLVATINYEVQTLMIERIGTHAEYGRWDLG